MGLTLAIPIFFLIFPRAYSDHIRSLLSLILTPMVKVSNTIVNKVYSVQGHWQGLSDLTHKNDELRQELERMTWEVVRLREISAEYERLRKLVDYKDSHDLSMVPARVIGRDPSLWYQVLVIDKGTGIGIKIGMPVVVSEGAIGRISQANEQSSQVLLLTDFRSRVDSVVQRTRELGIVRGDNAGGFILEYLSRNSDVKIGDIVLTSGLSGVFPKGLILGKVKKITEQKGGLNQFAVLEPQVDFGKFEEVLVIRETEWENLKS